ncbi:ATP/GTP-binding protein [Sinomonas cyclohexanicum]|uniref:ATP/GTP-binding protein n=1 Tax=Sinomonas cyclohexanicum TaxID=322009 RepID=A0ABN6FQD4_SINCY|nr:HpcH/HpaI aldolase/citrate lyase family protein [Corynebacterium cyclohexanicum]BCT77858.1 ATP/GTP-binding protein [Corynebacterium cyclohexanicum]
MLHYSFLTESARDRLFARPPQPLGRGSDAQSLAVGLGATLYTPGTRPGLADTVLKRARAGCASGVLCLEDAVADASVADAEDNVVTALTDLAGRDEASAAGFPLLFVRPRSPEQLLEVGRRLGPAADLLTGFVLPKFENTSGRGERFLDALDRLNRELDTQHALRAMPIVEHPVTTHRETRSRALLAVRDLLRARRDLILSVRLGTTDMSAAYGLRRSRDLTIYDVAVVAEVIADVVGILGRADEGWVISGPVWEHYSSTERILRPQLRATPFSATNTEMLRERLLGANLDGLIREIELDLANGLLGKTVIHPSHVPVVHALHTVSHEEYVDALDILAAEGGGATASRSGVRMNEAKPHRAWAQRTLKRADAFGVAHPDVTFVDLLEASMK